MGSKHNNAAGECEERRRRDRERLAEATRALLGSEGWKAWLRARATLHGYSLRNTLLIAQEGRRRGFTPRHVAGFKAWLKLGRCVRKGERGIAILAPVRVKQRDVEGEETGESRVFFRTAWVFDTLSRASPGGAERRRRAFGRRRGRRGDGCWAQLAEPLLQ
jgi:hypothetical protein